MVLRSIASMEGVESEHHEGADSVPLLRLKNWANNPLPIALFNSAALSPSRNRLALLSHNQQLVIVPLDHRSSALHTDSASAVSSPNPRVHGESVELASTSSTPFTPPRPSSTGERYDPEPLNSTGFQFSTGFAGGHQFSTPYATPAFVPKRLFGAVHGTPIESHSTTPFYTPCGSTPFFSSTSPTLSQQTSLSGSGPTEFHEPTEPTAIPSCLPMLGDVECFSWARCEDEFGANRNAGPFVEILLTSGKEGLVFHAFCGKKENGELDNENEKLVQQGPKRLEGEFNGKWRSWSLGEDELKNVGNGSHGEEQEDEEKGVSGKRKLSFVDENLSASRNSKFEEVGKASGAADNIRSSFTSFAVSGELQSFEGGLLQLQYSEHQPWPAHVECVSFCIPYESTSFSRLRMFAETSILREEESVGEADTYDDAENDLHIVRLLSSPAQNLVAVVLVKRSAAERKVDGEDVKEDILPHGPKLGQREEDVYGSFFVVIVRVSCWKLECVARVDASVTEEKQPGNRRVSQWVDFQLSDQVFVALKEDGMVFLWRALAGELIAKINVPHFCRVNLEVGGDEEAADLGRGVERVVGSDDTQELDLLRNVEDEEKKPSIDGYDNGSTQVVGEAAVTCTANNTLKTSEGGSAGGAKNRYTRLAVTADSLLIAVSDSRGLVFLVSTDEYFATHDFLSSEILPHRGHGSHCQDLRPLFSYEVAGAHIGGAKHSSVIPKRDWLCGSSEMEDTGTEVVAKGWKRDRKLLFSSFGDGLMGASGFTSRDLIAQHVNKGIGARWTQLQPLRKVFVPSKPLHSFLGMALNAYSITCAAANDSREVTLSQSGLRVSSKLLDEAKWDEKEISSVVKQKSYSGNIVAFSSQGCLYMVSTSALHVVLPPLATKPMQLPGSEGPWWLLGSGSETEASKWGCILPLDSGKVASQHWQTEVLDRCLVHDSLREAERLCLENGWSIQLMKLRRLQLALDYVQVDEVEESLESLVHVGAAEAGIPRVLFAAVELILSSFGSDNELAQATRLLELAARFSTRLIRSHGIWQQRCSRKRGTLSPASPRTSTHKQSNQFKPPSHVSELARLLEVIRTLQSRLQAKRKGPSRGTKADVNGEPFGTQGDGAGKLRPIIEFPSENQVQSVSEIDSAGDLTDVEQPRAPLTSEDTSSSRALVATGATGTLAGSGGSWGVSVGGGFDGKGRQGSAPESAGDMFARWENEEVDAESVVRDALRAGRVPLAVVQLHRIRSKAFLRGSQDHQPKMIDVFQDVQEIGRGIVYELLCKGKTALAMAALRRLGEDIDATLYELAFGTVRRGLRKQMRAELRRSSNRLGSRDSQLLEITSFLEELYPSSSFWSTYHGQKIKTASPSVDEPVSSKDDVLHLQLECDNGVHGTFSLQCQEVDGVVLGSWDYVAAPEVLDNSGGEQANASAGYLVLATVWLHPWDEGTVDRVILDQSSITGKHTSWGAQLEYHVAHHNWDKVSKLLDNVPHSVLYDGELQVHLDAVEDAEYLHGDGGHPDLDSADEHSPRVQHPNVVTCSIPKVHILGVNMRPMCSAWLWHMMEVKLVKSHIFLRTHWQGTTELVSLIASAGLLFQRSPGKTASTTSKQQQSAAGGGVPKETFQRDTLRALHELFVRHCVKYSLVNLLEKYLNHHSLAVEKGSMAVMQSVVGDCDWAQWLLHSRIKGREYDASFANAFTISAHKSNSGHGLVFGDGYKAMMAIEGICVPKREVMAIATLMYGPLPVQKCLVMGSANRQDLRSWQCSMEDLQSGLQSFPTLWHTLVTACYGHDAWSFVGAVRPKSGGSTRSLLGYLEWREALFQSAARDTSLMEMLPRWLPKRVCRLLHLAIQGVGRSQASVMGGNEALRVAMAEAARERVGHKVEVEAEEASVMELEDSIQKTIKEELHTLSPEEAGVGIEHHLQRGRPLAAFQSILSARIHSAGSHVTHLSRNFSSSYEAQTLLSHTTETEESLITAVLPIAIRHYEDTVVVAACVSFLELCGLSAQLLQVDVAALNRITSYLKEQGHGEDSLSAGLQRLKSGKYDGIDYARSLARALAEEYATAGLGVLNGKVGANQRPWKALLILLPLLEKATLRHDALKKVQSNAGAWLMNGVGDGNELRALQRSMSERWSLVTAFCRGHQLPLSTTYLATIARYNDWVGFLGEAQIECCSIDVLLKVASKEFMDLRLRSHILTVLKCLPTAPQKLSSQHADDPQFPSGSKGEARVGYENGLSGELFSLLAECETRKQPGRELLARAKDLRWPLLAVVGSCFQDVTSLSCLTVWLEITAARETSAIRVKDISTQISASVGAAVEATNSQLHNIKSHCSSFDRRLPKRHCLVRPELTSRAPSKDFKGTRENNLSEGSLGHITSNVNLEFNGSGGVRKDPLTSVNVPTLVEEQESLAAMVAVLCEQKRFLPLLRAFELFTPSSPLLLFVRFLQAFAQMRITEAGAHLSAFSGILKEEQRKQHGQHSRIVRSNITWITAAAVAAADAMLEACPSVYERRCLLQLLSAADFADGGLAAIRFRKLYWKMQLAEPALGSGSGVVANGSELEDDALLQELENNGQWEEARSWAGQLDLSSQRSSPALHHVTEIQAEAMVTEWKELLWDVREERAALWSHCQSLFIRHSYPPIRAGLFYLKHANTVEGEVPTSELHDILLLALQWLSGSFSNSSPVYPLHMLHELEIRVWLLAVESEVEAQAGRDQETVILGRAFPPGVLGSTGRQSSESTPGNPVDRTAIAVEAVDSHLKRSSTKSQATILSDDNGRGLARSHSIQIGEVNITRGGASMKMKRRTKQLKRTPVDTTEEGSPSDSDDSRLNNSVERRNSLGEGYRSSRIGEYRDSLNRHHSLPCVEIQNRDIRIPVPEVDPVDNCITPTDEGSRGWEERVGEGEVERAVLALVEVGQVIAARQLQQKLSPAHIPVELLLVEAAQKVAILSTPMVKGSVPPGFFLPAVEECLQSTDLPANLASVTPMQVLKALTMACREGCGRGHCHRIAAVAQVGNFLGLYFTEAFAKSPPQLLQLLSLKGKEALAEAKLLVETHSTPAATIARILAESFLKGLLAAHRGGYMESSYKEEGPAPLLWRPSDFKQWAQLCAAEPEVGHALMRLVISGRDIPHACEVELIILAHFYYESSACLDGIDVLVSLAATRVDSYVAEGDYALLARLVTGLSNFQRLRFILDVLVEHGCLQLLLQKKAVFDAAVETSVSIRAFCMAVLTALKHFNPYDHDALLLVYSHFNMPHDMAILLRQRADKCLERWVKHIDPERTEELLEPMRLYVEAAEKFADIDAGRSTRKCCAQASLISLQLRMPELNWLSLTETNARRQLVEQPRFQEALIVAEAYDLNQSAEWVPVLWNQMLQSARIDQYLTEFVAALPLPSSMLMELARFYRQEVSARGDHFEISKWLTPGGAPLEPRFLGKSMRSLLKLVRDFRVRIQLATIATGFPDVVDACMQLLDKVPDSAGPLILRKGHGQTYIPLM